MATLRKKSFNAPDATHVLPNTKIEIVSFDDMSVVRATLESGWRWSEHIKPIAGTESAEETHFSYILSGRFHIVMNDGTETDLGPGDIAIVPPGHQAWVIGDEPVVSLDFQGASRNA